MIGVCRATVYNWIASGHFPPPIRLGPNTVAWRASDVEEWIDSRSQLASAEAS